MTAFARIKTLHNAEGAFHDNPSNETAGTFMAAAMECEAEGDIDDDTWLNCLAEIRDYLKK